MRYTIIFQISASIFAIVCIIIGFRKMFKTFDEICDMMRDYTDMRTHILREYLEKRMDVLKEHIKERFAKLEKEANLERKKGIKQEKQTSTRYKERIGEK